MLNLILYILTLIIIVLFLVYLDKLKYKEPPYYIIKCYDNGYMDEELIINPKWLLWKNNSKIQAKIKENL